MSTERYPNIEVRQIHKTAYSAEGWITVVDFDFKLQPTVDAMREVFFRACNGCKSCPVNGSNYLPIKGGLKVRCTGVCGPGNSPPPIYESHRASDVVNAYFQVEKTDIITDDSPVIPCGIVPSQIFKG